jgi:hypothetical protein
MPKKMTTMMTMMMKTMMSKKKKKPKKRQQRLECVPSLPLFSPCQHPTPAAPTGLSLPHSPPTGCSFRDREKWRDK